MIPDERAATDTEARNRFALINLVRLGGVAMVLLGLAISEGVVDWPKPIGYGLIAFGFAGTFFVPKMLANIWRTPGP